MARLSDVKKEVDFLNEQLCKKTKNRFAIDKAYNGIQVVLTGKEKDKGLKTAVVDITPFHGTSADTLLELQKRKKWLKSIVGRFEKN